MQKNLVRLIPILIISFGVLLADSACAVWPFTSGRKPLASEQTVASSSGPVTGAGARASRTIMRTFNPCHGPSCLTVVDLAYCAERTGFALADFLNNEEKLFYTTPNQKEEYQYTTAVHVDINENAWMAAYQTYKQANTQFQLILQKQNDVNSLLNDIDLNNEAQRSQVEEEQAKLALMQKQYLRFLAKNDLFNVQKFVEAQNKLEATMGRIGEDPGVSLPQAIEPKEDDPKYSERKTVTVRIMDRAVQKAIQEFSKEHFFCYENFCYHNCVQKALYTEKDVKNFLNPDSETTIVDVTRAQANFVFKTAQKCIGGDPKASTLRVLCSRCTEGFLGKSVRPIAACTNVQNNEFKKQEETQQTGFGGFGGSSMF